MLISKTCSTCKNDKPVSEFYRDKSKKDGLTAMCVQCRRSYEKKYYQDNAEKLRERSRAWYRDNSEKANSASRKMYYENIEHRKAKRKEAYWRDREENIRKSSEYHLARIKTDGFYRFQARCRKRVWAAFRESGYSKRSKTFDLIGCDKDSLMAYIEAMFHEGMSWDNYGEWHIDHIIPLSSAENEREVELLCHYLNVQPLWASDNVSKSAKFCPNEKAEMIKRIKLKIEHASHRTAA